MINDDGLMKNTLVRLSNGEISLMQATREIGYQDAGYTLEALRVASLTPFQLGEQVIVEQACRGLDPLRDAMKTK
jgi:hypothetical protein